MANYRLPMDADGVKYHGTVDQNEENPGHFMYGLDENGNKRIIRTDEQGNVLTRMTGSIVEKIVVVNNEAYADDKIHNYPLDVSKYKQVIFLAYHTMDKPPTIGLRIPNSEHPLMVYKNNEWNRQDSSYGIKLTSANRFMYNLNSYWDFLDRQAFESINLTVRLADGIPTTGALNITMLGVLR